MTNCISEWKTLAKISNSNQRRKISVSNPLKAEPGKRKRISHQKLFLSQKERAHSILASKEWLQKAGIPIYIPFNRVGYSQSGANFILLTEKSNLKEPIDIASNILMRVSELVHDTIIRTDALKRWEQWNVPGMSLV